MYILVLLFTCPKGCTIHLKLASHLKFIISITKHGTSRKTFCISIYFSLPQKDNAPYQLERTLSE